MKIQSDMTLRTDPGPFRAVWRGDKTAELRNDDRGYQVGDVVTLIEFDRTAGKWIQPHREVVIRITHITRVLDWFGINTVLKPVVLSFKVLQRRQHGVRNSGLCRGCRGDRAANP